MVSRRHALWLIAPACLVAWLCLRSPVPEPDSATAERLEAAAELWWQPGGTGRDIPEADWPTELRRLGPEAVTVAAEGVYIRFGTRFVEAWGLFVLPRGSEFQPRQGADPSFRPVRGRIYRYDIKG